MTPLKLPAGSAELTEDDLGALRVSPPQSQNPENRKTRPLALPDQGRDGEVSLRQRYSPKRVRC